MNKEDFENLDNHHIDINQKAKALTFLVFVVMVLIFFIIGNLNSYDNKTNIYNNRLYSRVHLQVSNALYDTSFQIEKYLRTNTFNVLENSLSRLKSAVALFEASITLDFDAAHTGESYILITRSQENLKKIISSIDCHFYIIRINGNPSRLKVEQEITKKLLKIIRENKIY